MEMSVRFMSVSIGIIVTLGVGEGLRGTNELKGTPIVAAGSKMKLIAEQIQDVEYITEDKDGGGKEMKIRGIFMQAVKIVTVEYTQWVFFKKKSTVTIKNLLSKVVRLGNLDTQRE